MSRRRRPRSNLAMMRRKYTEVQQGCNGPAECALLPSKRSVVNSVGVMLTPLDGPMGLYKFGKEKPAHPPDAALPIAFTTLIMHP